MSKEEAQQVLQECLGKRGSADGKLIFAMLAGSYAFNLSLDSSLLFQIVFLIFF